MNNLSYHVLINAQAGLASDAGREAIENRLEQSGLSIEGFYFLDSEAFSDKLKELSKGEAPVLIGGGDGTICSAARLFLDKKASFGVLPFGTMNMLSKDLGIPVNFPDMFSAYKNASEIHIDVCTLNGIPFLCASSLGVMPEASKFREEIRKGGSDFLTALRVGAFVFDEMDESKQRIIKISLDSNRQILQTNAVVVSNNRYMIPVKREEYNFRRASLQDEEMGVYIVSPHNTWERLRFMTRLLTGFWKRDPVLREYVAQTVMIETGREKELVSIDGEPMEIETPLKFRLLPKALSVLVPAKEEKL